MTQHGLSPHEPEAAHASTPHRRWEWRLLGVCALGTLVFGTLGSLELQQEEAGGGSSLSNALYQAFQLFTLHAPRFAYPVPFMLDAGRWLGAASTIIAVVEFGRHALREELGRFHLRRMRGHVIVCGFGRKGLAAVRGQIDQGRKGV